MLANMEAQVFDTPTLVLRVHVGFTTLVAHGCLRCADAQHCEHLYPATDALVGTSWKTKKHEVLNLVGSLDTDELKSGIQ